VGGWERIFIEYFCFSKMITAWGYELRLPLVLFYRTMVLI